MKLPFATIIVTLALIGLSCSTVPPSQGGSTVPSLPHPATCDGIHDFFAQELRKYQDGIDEANREYQEEEWQIKTADPKGSQEKLSQLFEQVQKRTYDSQILTQAQRLDDSTQDLLHCAFKPELSRARHMFDATILTNPEVIHKEKENADWQERLVGRNDAFRLALPDEKEPVSRALYAKKLSLTTDRSVRRKLYVGYNAARAKHWIDWGFRDLIKSRNEEARLAGFDNYYDYQFFRNQLDLKNYLALVSQVRDRLAPKLAAAIRKLGVDHKLLHVQAWDLPYLRAQAESGDLDDLLKKLPADVIMPIAREFYSGLGISVEDYHFTMDLYPRSGKDTHAFAMGVVLPHVDEQGKLLPEPKTDIRFLANLKVPVRWTDVSTVIHELGHAVHAANIRQPIGVFRDMGSVGTEAIAMTLERMAGTDEFMGAILPKYTGTSPDALKPILAKQVRGARFAQAYMLTRQIFFSDFEHQMYLHPDADFAKLWSRLHKQYWGVQIIPRYADWDVEHFLPYPVYVQNYAIGIVMVEQLYASILRDFHTSYDSSALGDKLRNVYFAPGTEFTYLDLVEHFSGSPLSADDAMKLMDQTEFSAPTESN